MEGEGTGRARGRKGNGGRQEGDVGGLLAKFYVNVFIVSASGGEKAQFWANFDLGGSRNDPRLPMRVKFGVLEQTQGLHLHAKFHLNVFILSAAGGQKPQCWANCDF